MKTLPYLALLSLLLMTCSKPKQDVLPAATQTGANTFACLVDGKLWLPKGDLTRKGVDLSYDPTWNGGTMSIKAWYWKHDNVKENITSSQNISLSIGQMSKPGTYSLVASNQQGLAGYSYGTDYFHKPPYFKGCTYDIYRDTKTGTLTITKIDLEKGFISGTFEFTQSLPDSVARAKDCPPTVRVTEGRFDLKI